MNQAKKFDCDARTYRILYKNSSLKLARKFGHLAAIRIGMSKMAKDDNYMYMYMDYPDETLERMAKLWSTIVIVM